MNANLRHHYNAIQQLARDEWSSEPGTRARCEIAPESSLPMEVSAYRAAYTRTLARIREERPDTFAALKTILDHFTPPSAGDAFFPGGAEDELVDALADAGWDVRLFSSSNVYSALHPVTRAKLHHLDGELYDRTRVHPVDRRHVDAVTRTGSVANIEETNRWPR